MRLFVLALLFVAHFGNAQGDADSDEDCTEAQQRAINGRPLSQRRFMWWPYDACSNGFTYVTCDGDLKCNGIRRQWGGPSVATRTLWTHTRGGNSVSQANDFVDTVLLQRMPTLIRETFIQGHLSLPYHYFKVYKTSWTNRDLKVNVLSGRFRHFNTAVTRSDDCVLSMVAGNVSVSCRLDVDGIVAELQTETKGDNLFATTKSVRVDARMSGMTGRLEVTSAMNQPAYLRTFIVENGYFDVTVGHNLELNSVRMSNFESNIRRYLGQQLQEKFYSYYETLLGHAFSRMSFFLF